MLHVSSIARAIRTHSGQRYTKREYFSGGWRGAGAANPVGGLGGVPQSISELPIQVEAALGESRQFMSARNRLGAACHPQLAEQIAHMLLSRGHGDYKLCGDLAVGCAGRQEAQHLLFAPGE